MSTITDSPPTYDRKTDTSDFTISIERKNIHVEKSRLANMSPYFNNLFKASDFKTNQKIMTVDGDYAGLLACIQILHGHSLEQLNDVADMEPVLAAAISFDFPTVRMICEMALASMHKQLVDAFLLAGKYNLVDVQARIEPSINNAVVKKWLERWASGLSSHKQLDGTTKCATSRDVHRLISRLDLAR